MANFGASLQTTNNWALVTLALGAMCGIISGTYVSDKKYETVHHKSNKILDDEPSVKGYGSLFRHDKDVRRYLSIFGTDAMIWRCKNAIQPYWNWKPLPVVELYCEAIGTMRDIKWYHNGEELNIGNRHKLSIYPHHHGGHYFYTWIDFRLRIFNATHKDSGIYTFEVIGKHGSIKTQNVYVDISEKRRKRKWRKHHKSHHKDSSYSRKE